MTVPGLFTYAFEQIPVGLQFDMVSLYYVMDWRVVVDAEYCPFSFGQMKFFCASSNHVGCGRDCPV
ncbi:MAG: hypothetical protein PHT00_02705 [Candidatus Methanomethylophilus sp.]|nr:hypothetical protein [Methanomethylophilus sp.]MDD4668887.1 hypothetical protein [Methanomethylophilus sp.]